MIKLINLERVNDNADSQPFFSIESDLAPAFDLCIDANLIDCDSYREEENCGDFDHIDTTDWTCHRIVIPSEYVGYISTLNITATDCGQGCHFGYAYVDGICEECTGSALGSVTLYDQPWSEGIGNIYRTCDGDTITICGTYTLPDICGTWVVDSNTVPGFIIHNLEIDTANKSFCFEIDISQFPEDSCRELFAMIYFRSNTSKHSDVVSNNIKICDTDFLEFLTTATISSCYDNNTDVFISDDYYYVYANVYVFNDDPWTMDKNLSDPYPDELGKFELKTGNGSDMVKLGPFLIQEGSWELIIHYIGCSDTIIINPPNFCPECENFVGLKISDIACHDPEDPADYPADDTWSFDLEVPYIGVSDDFELKIGNILVGVFDYNEVHIITPGLISNGCLTYTIIDDDDEDCLVQFTVCPPKPCSSGSECAIEAYITDYEFDCDEEEFYVNFDVTSVPYICYQTAPVSDINNFSAGAQFSNPLGPFMEDMIIKFSVCSTSSCNCMNPECFKYVYVPDFEEECPESLISSDVFTQAPESLLVFPNPMVENELTIYSPFSNTNFEIYNLSDQLIYSGQFSDAKFKLIFEQLPGVYILKYRSDTLKMGIIKFIKF